MASELDIQALADSISQRSTRFRGLSVSAGTGVRIAALFVLIAGILYLVRGTSEPAKYVVAEVTRGAIVRTVTATGTLNPVIAVQVGSYVSGPIIAIYADFNAAVKKGQLIAEIDPQPFELKLEEARAAFEFECGFDQGRSRYALQEAALPTQSQASIIGRGFTGYGR